MPSHGTERVLHDMVKVEPQVGLVYSSWMLPRWTLRVVVLMLAVSTELGVDSGSGSGRERRDVGGCACCELIGSEVGSTGTSVSSDRCWHHLLKRRISGSDGPTGSPVTESRQQGRDEKFCKLHASKKRPAQGPTTQYVLASSGRQRKHTRLRLCARRAHVPSRAVCCMLSAKWFALRQGFGRVEPGQRG